MENMARRSRLALQERESASMLGELRFDPACGHLAVNASADPESREGARRVEDDQEPRSLDQEQALDTAWGAGTVNEVDSKASEG